MLNSVLGEDLLAELIGVSPSGLGTVAGAQTVPGHGAARLGELAGRGQFLRLLVADLVQTRDPEGVRSWFQQRQRALPGGSPAAAVRSIRDADAPEARQLRELAATPDPLPRSSRDRRRMLDLVRFEQSEPERRDMWRSRRV